MKSALGGSYNACGARGTERRRALCAPGMLAGVLLAASALAISGCVEGSRERGMNLGDAGRAALHVPGPDYTLMKRIEAALNRRPEEGLPMRLTPDEAARVLAQARRISGRARDQWLYDRDLEPSVWAGWAKKSHLVARGRKDPSQYVTFVRLSARNPAAHRWMIVGVDDRAYAEIGTGTAQQIPWDVAASAVDQVAGMAPDEFNRGDLEQAAAPPRPSVAERLQQLEELRQKKLITEDEYQAKRKELLDQL